MKKDKNVGFQAPKQYKGKKTYNGYPKYVTYSMPDTITKLSVHAFM